MKNNISISRLIEIMLELYKSDQEMFFLAISYLADPFQSQRNLAAKTKISVATVCRRLQYLRFKYPEFRHLADMKKIMCRKKSTCDIVNGGVP